MRSETRNRAAALALAGSLLALGACADNAPTTSPLLPDQPSLLVGDATNNTPVLELLKVCKVWVNAPVADIDVNLSGDRTGEFTVPAASGTAPNTCIWVATQGASAAATITVTEDDPGANFTTTWAVNSTDDAQDASGSGTAATATIGGTGIPGAVITFTNTFVPPTGNEGCTPGYWKQPHHFDSWPAGFDPDDDFDTVFGVNFFSPDITLEDALNLGGGGKNALARHAVAALLNAASGFYPLTTVQVIAAVQAAFADQSTIESTKNTLAANNELGCPLN